MTRALATNPVAVAQGFHALSDPIRVEIVDLLRGGERCVCELMDALDAAQSRLSFHLKVLREAGLVTDRREGKWVYYTLSDSALSELQEYLAQLQRSTAIPVHISKRTACCD